MRRITYLLFAVIAWVTSIDAQTPDSPKIKVGDSIINASRLMPYKNSWRVTVSSAEGQLLGETAIWNDDLQTVEKNGKACLQRTQQATFSNHGKVVGTSETVNIFARDTMAPLWADSRHMHLCLDKKKKRLSSLTVRKRTSGGSRTGLSPRERS